MEVFLEQRPLLRGGKMRRVKLFTWTTGNPTLFPKLSYANWNSCTRLGFFEPVLSSRWGGACNWPSQFMRSRQVKGVIRLDPSTYDRQTCKYVPPVDEPTTHIDLYCHITSTSRIYSSPTIYKGVWKYRPRYHFRVSGSKGLILIGERHLGRCLW